MLFLIGFMAAGKTSVGRAIAAASGRPFLDLDDAIAALGEPVAQLVARDEPEFRRREAAVLADAIARGGDAVVATGGGAAAFGDNLARMRAAGLVIALGVDVAAAKVRAESSGGERPLIARAEQLAAARAATYRRAHAVIDTTDRALDEVVAEVIAVERAWRTLPDQTATLLALGARTYPIAVAHDLGRLAPAIQHALAGATKVALVTDDNVARAWGDTVRGLLPADLVVRAIPPGEASKSLARFDQLAGELIAAGLDRGSAIVALGGGVVGDLAGFVAATLYRGIAVVQIPTTIVAMTDAAIGGKTAVDLPAGKNLVGAFHQPRLVACALETLATLPARERRAGFGELWKYALLDGRDLWALVDACAAWAAAEHPAPPPAELAEVVARSIAYKAAVVSRDELERSGHRALLNLGHTVGHAIESQTGLLHGEAVGLGLVAAARVSAGLGLAPPALASEIAAALARTGLPADLDAYLADPAPILERLRVDKKRLGGDVRFIAIRDVGACEPVRVPLADVDRILRRGSAP